MRFKLFSILLCAAAVAVAGCGGGGGAPTTVISGVASKGPINGGAITVRAVRNGQVAEQLGPTTPVTTGATGTYSIDIGSYTGPVVVEVSGGTYVNEATGGAPVTLNVPLRAFVPNAVTGGNQVAVTALTEMAAKKIAPTGATDINATKIQQFNIETGALFGVADIVATQPVDALQASSGASQAQKEYALALAAVSQYAASNSRTLGQALNDLAPSVPSPPVLDALSAAITTFVTSPRNLTGITGNVNATQVTLTLSTQGTLPGTTKIGGLDLAVNLPVGITAPTFQAGQPNQVAETSLQFASGVPVDNSRFIFGGFSSAGAGRTSGIKIAAIHNSGFNTGAFATLVLPKTAGTALTPLHFSITGFGVVDTTSGPNAITGLTPTLSASFQ